MAPSRDPCPPLPGATRQQASSLSLAGCIAHFELCCRRSSVNNDHRVQLIPDLKNKSGHLLLLYANAGPSCVSCKSIASLPTFNYKANESNHLYKHCRPFTITSRSCQSPSRLIWSPMADQPSGRALSTNSSHLLVHVISTQHIAHGILTLTFLQLHQRVTHRLRRHRRAASRVATFQSLAQFLDSIGFPLYSC